MSSRSLITFVVSREDEMDAATESMLDAVQHLELDGWTVHDRGDPEWAIAIGHASFIQETDADAQAKLN